MVARVRCTRCDRPVCPACQRPASVGVHCPEEGSAASPRVRTRWGGAVSTDLGALPKALAVLLVGSGLLTTLQPRLVGRLGLVPSLVAPEPWRLLTTGLVHSGLLHLLLNTLALVSLLPPLEDVLGRGRVLALLGVSLVAGSTAVVVASAPGSLTVGASGAVLGLLGAHLVVDRAAGLPVAQPAAWLAGLLVLSVLVPRISLAAHLGGLLAGLVLAGTWAAVPPRLRGPAGWAAPVALLAVLVAVLAVRVAALG